MALFTWNAQYRLGLEPMDAEHMQLFALADELHAALAQGASRQLVRKRLSGLIDHARAHFAHEEEWMRRHQYPGLNAHRIHHEGLISKALDFQRDLVAERAVLSAGTLQFLKDWLTLHLASEDRSAADYLISARAGSAG